MEVLIIIAPADLKEPLEEIATLFEKELKTETNPIETHFTYYREPESQIERTLAAKTGDVFIADVDATLDRAEDEGVMLHDRKNIFYKRLAMGMQKKNPTLLFSLADLTRPGIRVGLVKPGEDYLGDLTQETLARQGISEKLGANVVAQVSHPEELTELLLADKADAVICWDTLELLVPEQIVIMRFPWKVCESKGVPAAVVEFSQNKKLAEDFVEFIASKTAKAVFSKHGYCTSSGESGGRGMDGTARTAFAPLYPLLAKQIVEDCGITEGIALDIGCGPGQLLVELGKITDMQIWGLDIEPQALEILREHAREAGLDEERIHTVVGDVHNIPLPDDFADFIVSRGSMPFWKDRTKALQEIYRILKPGGGSFVGVGFSRYQSEEEIVKMKPGWKSGEWGSDDCMGFSSIMKEIGVAQFEVFTDEGCWLNMHK